MTTDACENTIQFTTDVEDYEYAFEDFEKFLAVLVERNQIVGGYFKVTIEYHTYGTENELCPHGDNWDDCPDCRH